MSTDYPEAAIRHRADAELLFDRKRWPNADQLYGLAAECGLKALMKALGMPVCPDGAPASKRHRIHIDRLWDEFHTFASGHAGAEYAGALSDNNPFADWSIHQRYYHSASISIGAVKKHQDGESVVHRVVCMARLDGRLA